MRQEIVGSEGSAFVAQTSSTRRRRFLVVSVAGLAVLAVAMGVSFADNSGTTSIIVSSSSTAFVFPVANTNSVPSGVTALKYTGTSGIASGSFTSSVVLPNWSPVAGSAGSVTTAGDLVVLDARAATLGDHAALRVNLYVTNLNQLQQAYSSFAFPVNVYRCASTCTSTPAWSQASAVVASPPTYLTNTDGFLTFSLAAGYFYDITFDIGGSFYTISTSNGSLNPSFYFTAQST